MSNHRDPHPDADAATYAEAVDPDAPVRESPRDRQWDVTLVIAAGGVVGAEARYGLSLALPHVGAAFPWSTVVTNVAGCLGIGVLMAVLARLATRPRLVRPFVGIGILGGFTTFSTFAVDTQRLLLAHRPGSALAYVVLTLVAGAVAVALGTAAVSAVANVRRTAGVDA